MEDIPIEDMIADQSAESPDQRIDADRRQRGVLNVVNGLKELEAVVLRLYFGLGQVHALTLEEISQRLDVSPERIRQIKENALHRLRHPQPYSTAPGRGLKAAPSAEPDNAPRLRHRNSQVSGGFFCAFPSLMLRARKRADVAYCINHEVNPMAESGLAGYRGLRS